MEIEQLKKKILALENRIVSLEADRVRYEMPDKISANIQNVVIPLVDNTNSLIYFERDGKQFAVKTNSGGVTGTVYVAASSGGAVTTAITFTKGIRTS